MAWGTDRGRIGDLASLNGGYQSSGWPSTSRSIAVSDSGTGRDPFELKQVFDRFHKGSTSAGSGLGLTISRALVEAHGGTIAMTSEPGRARRCGSNCPEPAGLHWSSDRSGL